MAVQALAGEIVAALLADEKDGGYDLTAGLFGTSFSALVHRWAAAEWAAKPTQAEAPSELDAFQEAEAQIRHLVEDLTSLKVEAGVSRYEAHNNLLFSNCIAAMDRLLPRLRAALATHPAPEQVERGLAAIKACQSMAADGWLSFGAEGMSAAQKAVLDVIDAARETQATKGGA